MRKELPVKSIRLAAEAQPRENIDVEVTADYAEALKAGAQFPPVVVFYDGETYWLGDGFHRVLAHESIGVKTIDADVRKGDLRAAILFSCGANATHGLRRTNADKRRAVLKLLEDDEWKTWPDNEVARQAGVSQPFVGKLKSKLSYNGYKIDRTRTVTRNGSTYTQNTTKIGRSKKKAAFTCPECQEAFDAPVWHCPDCNDHWPKNQDYCPNCISDPGPQFTAEERKAIEKKLGDKVPGQTDITFKAIYAIQQLAGMPVGPEEYNRICRPESRYRVDDHLESAATWLARLHKVWSTQ